MVIYYFLSHAVQQREKCTDSHSAFAITEKKKKNLSDRVDYNVVLEVSGIQCSLSQFTKCVWWCAVGWKAEPGV